MEALLFKNVEFSQNDWINHICKKDLIYFRKSKNLVVPNLEHL